MALPGAPSIERPDEHKAGEAGEQYCWINGSQECNASCVAFDNRSLTQEGISPCTVLNLMRAFQLTMGKLASGLTSKPLPPPPTVPLGDKR